MAAAGELGQVWSQEAAAELEQVSSQEAAAAGELGQLWSQEAAAGERCAYCEAWLRGVLTRFSGSASERELSVPRRV